MYNEYLLKLEEAGEIRNLKERSINCYKNYVSYFLNYVKKNPEELTCQDVREFLLAKKKEGWYYVKKKYKLNVNFSINMLHCYVPAIPSHPVYSNT